MSKNVQIPRGRKHHWWPTWKGRLVAWEVGTCQHLRHAAFAMMRAYCIQKMSKVLQKYA